MNIYDIAARAGTSIATVSRVINNDPSVKPATRKRILSVIEASGYVPARGRNKSKKIYIVMVSGSASEPENSRLVLLCTRLYSDGFEPCIVCCHDDDYEKRALINDAAVKRPLAIVLNGADFITSETSNSAFFAAVADVTPLVFLGNGPDGDNIYTVSVDAEKAVYDLVKQCIKDTKSLPVFLFSSMGSYHMDMLSGYRIACSTLTSDIPPEYIHLCDPRTDSACNYVSGLLNSEVEFNTVITTDNRIAEQLAVRLSSSVLTIYGYGSGPRPFPYINTRDDAVCNTAVSIIKGISVKGHVINRTVITPTLSPTAY